MDEPVSEGNTSPNLDKLTDIYIKIRDARAEIKADFDARDTVLKEQLGLLEAEMLDACKDLNASSIKKNNSWKC